VNISWTGKQDYLHPKQKEQLDTKFGKIGKLLDVDGKGEKKARVALTQDKTMHRVEVTLNYLDHTLVGEHLDPDQFTALTAAVEKLERQMLKVREKRRDVRKGPREDWDKSSAANTVTEAEPRSPERLPAAPAAVPNGKPKVFRVAPDDGKPLTFEEAMLVIDDKEPYFVYRNAETDRLAVLMRRPDGNFDLVEC